MMTQKQHPIYTHTHMHTCSSLQMAYEMWALTPSSLISCGGGEAAVIKLGCKSEMQSV